MKAFYKYLLIFSIPISSIFIYMDYKESNEIHLAKHVLVAVVAGILFAYTVVGINKRRKDKES